MEMMRNFWSNLRSSSSSSSSSTTEAGSSVASNAQSTTNQFKRINNHVYELRAGTNPKVDVVFVHGLPLNQDEANTNQAFWRIWTERDSDKCWPVSMLPGYLAEKVKDGDHAGYDPRVLAVSYDSRYKLPPKVATDDYNLSENLMTDLILSSEVGVGQERPVILVGHDLGGILIKQLILYVENTADTERDRNKSYKLNEFLENLGSVFFYSTPHLGSPAIERLAKEISNNTQNQMLQFLSVLGNKMSRVNGDFSDYRQRTLDNPRFATFALTTLYPTYKGYFKGEQVCLEGSARTGIDTYYSVQADHYEVCQPEGTWCNSIQLLAHNIVKVVDEFAEGQREIRLQELKKFSKVLKGSDANDEALQEAITSS